MNDATAYQQLTRNPQSNEGASLQPNSTASGASQSGSLNPQILPKPLNLQVARPATTGRVVTSTQANDQPIPTVANSQPLWVFSIVTAVLAVGLLALAKFAKPAGQSSNKATVGSIDKAITPTITANPKKKRQQSKKKASKKSSRKKR